MNDWFEQVGRPLPWRNPGVSPWAVLVSEVMSQQTPVARVAPAWQAWQQRWPVPYDVAHASRAEILKMWGKLGYPRRALRLWECANQLVVEHNGQVPADVSQLLALPGIGDYTARAVAAFAFGQRVAAVDINVRRVYRRAWLGQFDPGAATTKSDITGVQAVLDRDPSVSPVSLMELGALVCRPRPLCPQCPLQPQCAWVAAGSPIPESAPARRKQKYVGTDRQVRGLLLDVLRAHPTGSGVVQRLLDAVWDDAVQRTRALDSLLDDGLLTRDAAGLYYLPH